MIVAKRKCFAHRSRRRGAAFIEALIVISFLILGFLGLVFFRELYVKQLRASRLARASMITHAMTGCGNENQPGQWIGIRDLGTLRAAGPNTGNQTAVPQNGTGQQVSGTGQGGEVLGRVGASGNGVLNPVGISDLSGTTSTETRPSLTGQRTRFSANPRSRSFVSCTDPVRNGGFKDAVGFIGGLFKTTL